MDTNTGFFYAQDPGDASITRTAGPFTVEPESKLRFFSNNCTISCGPCCRTCGSEESKMNPLSHGLCSPCFIREYPHLCSPCLTCRLPVPRGNDACPVCIQNITNIAKRLGIDLAMMKKTFQIKHPERSYIEEMGKEIWHRGEVQDRLPGRTETPFYNEKSPHLPRMFPGFYFGSGVWKEPSREEFMTTNRYGILTEVGSSTKGAKR